MAYSPKFVQIYDKIKSDIEAGVYQLDSYLLSERKLSEQFQVQRATIRKALELLTSDGYIEKNPGSGNKVIYEQSTPESNASTVLYIIPDHEFSQQFQPFHWEICLFLEKLCKKEGLSLNLMKVSEVDTVSTLTQRISNVKGVIGATFIKQAFFDTLLHKGIPTVEICGSYPSFPKVNLDDFGGAFTATQHLIDRGCKNIVFFKGLDSYENITLMRFKGYVTALNSNNLAYNEDLVITGDWNYDSGYNGMMQLINSNTPFDGIVGSNDMMALGAMNALYQKQIPVPSKVKVAGIDNIQYSAISTPSLTTVSFSQWDIALSAFIMLKELMNGGEVPDEVLIPGKLITRNST